MNGRSQASSAFSLVEVVLALGVAAFCLIAVLGMLPVGLKIQQAGVQQTKANAIISIITDELRAAVRLPPGQAAKLDSNDPQQKTIKTLNGHWLAAATPDTLYFTNDGKYISINGTVPTDAVFRAKITYYAPPTPGYTTSLADVIISWPAQVDPAAGVPAGSAETFVAINR